MSVSSTSSASSSPSENFSSSEKNQKTSKDDKSQAFPFSGHILGNIVSFLPVKEQLQAQQVAKSWRNVRVLVNGLKDQANGLAVLFLRAKRNEKISRIPHSVVTLGPFVKKLTLNREEISLCYYLENVFPKVQELYLLVTQQTVSDLSKLASLLPNLHTLYLTDPNNLIRDENLKVLGECKDLKRFGISKSLPSNTTGAFLESLPQTITELILERYRITDEAILGLQDKKQLKKLTIIDSPIKGVHFDKLPLSLEELLCRKCQNLTNEAIFKLHNMPRLVVLSLQGAVTITGEYFDYLPSLLRKLDLTGCFNFQDDSILKLQNKKDLKSLSFAGIRIKGTYLDKLPPTLTELSLRYCLALQSENSMKLKALKIQSLNLHGTKFSFRKNFEKSQ